MSDIVETLRQGSLTRDDYRWEAADLITALRAENSSLSAWQCVYTDGKTGLVGDEHGNQYCAMAKRVEALRAENEKLRAALWDIHAVCNNWDWFIWMWPIRRIKRIARTALEEPSDE